MLPRVIVHSLVSVDGKIEGFSPEGIGLYYHLADQLQCDTCLVGSSTLLEAEALPSMEVHPIDEGGDALPQVTTGGGPLMVVPDSRGRLRNWYTHTQGVGARGSVALVSAATPQEYLLYLRKRNIPYVRAGEDHVDFRIALAELRASYGSEAIRTDSGGVLNNVLLEQGLVTEISLLLSPELVGRECRALFRTLEIPVATGLDLEQCERVGERYVWLRYRLRSRAM